MSSTQAPFDIQAARRHLAERERLRQEKLDERFARACQDVDAIIAMAVRVYDPERIYQWGSLLDRDRFTEASDIDLAVEGMGPVERFFNLVRDAEALTRFPLDLVEMERVDPLHARSIREKGRLVHEHVRSP